MKHPAPYRFPDPVSPHLAARRAGVKIELARIVAWVAACTAPWTIIETAGGLLSPLAPGITNLDLVRLLAPDVILLVGVDRLGVLHDVTACLLALNSSPGLLPTPVVVLQAPEVADGSTSTNAEELVTLGLLSEAFTLPRGTASETITVDAARAVLEHIQARRLG